MGKTENGAVWLDASKTSPYEFYQYWRNINDADVEKCLKLLTFVELEEIDELCKYQDERINKAKERLAFEVTKIVHSEQDAIEAQNASRAAFVTGDSENMPQTEIEKGINQVVDIMVAINNCQIKRRGKKAY